MAGSERLLVLKAISDAIDSIEERMFDDSTDDATYKLLLKGNNSLWAMHQDILATELTERISIAKTRTKALNSIAAALKKKSKSLQDISEQIKKAAGAVDKLVELTKKSIDIVTSLT